MNDVIVSTEREDITQDDLLTTVNSLDELLECHSVTYNDGTLRIEDVIIGFTITNEFYARIKELFPGIIDLYILDCTFTHTMRMANATIKYSLYFCNVIFERPAYFSNVTFEEKAEFLKVIFKGKVSFLKTIFKGNISFSRAIFEGDTSFSYATFEEEAEFLKVIFKGKVSFLRTIFKVKVWFSRAIFEGDAKFSHATFEREVEFLGADFKGKADFSRTIFKGNIGFSRAIFEGEASFSYATFEREVEFLRAIFKSDTGFLRAIFKDKVGFSRAMFEGEVEFLHTTFQGSTYFWRTIFKNKADFNAAHFHLEASFSSMYVHSQILFAKTIFDNNIIFENCNFNDTIIFENILRSIEMGSNKLSFISCFFYDNSILILRNFVIDDDVIIEASAMRGSVIMQNIKANLFSLTNSVVTGSVSLAYNVKFAKTSGRYTDCILKHEAQKIGDAVNYLKYRKEEQIKIYEEVLSDKKYLKWFADWFVAKLNFISTDFGQSWVRGVVFTVVSAMICVFILQYKSDQIIFTTNISSIIDYLPIYWNDVMTFLWLPNIIHKGSVSIADGSMTIFVIGKILIGFGIYQTITAFRRHGK